MPRKSLRPHLNQIRAWVRQGRTDAWVAHQLEVTVRDIEQFKRQNELVSDDETPEGTSGAGDYPEEIDLRAEDDALIAAELEAAEAEAARRARPSARSDEAEARRGQRQRRATSRGLRRTAHPSPQPPRRTRPPLRRHAAPARSRAPSTTARRATACGSTPPSRRTPSTPSTGPDTGRSRSRSRRTASSSAAPATATSAHDVSAARLRRGAVAAF